MVSVLLHVTRGYCSLCLIESDKLFVISFNAVNVIEVLNKPQNVDSGFCRLCIVKTAIKLLKFTITGVR